jgi:RNA polymerase sigma factor (sigma-70 family)
MNQVIQQLRTMILRDGEDPSDGKLLECFLAQREGSALEALVRRHGAMVWGVCRRVLANHHDAEDAFQATFLVLVRKASSIKPRDMVGNWLYGVARQTALKARARSATRQMREKQVSVMPEPAQGPTDLSDDLTRLLDQELSQLPDKYRAVLVLCELEGKTLKVAAEQLGLPDGTVASRLARARNMLAKRLGRYKLAISAGALPALLAQQAAAAIVPAPVLAAAIKSALLVAGGKAMGILSAPVVALTEEVVKAMLITKIGKISAVLLVVIASCGLGYGAYAQFGAGPVDSAVTLAPKRDPLPEPTPKARSPEDAAKIRVLFKANANEFEITITRHGKGSPKVDLRSIMLHVTNRRFEPAARGPSGQPIFKNARITKEQALNIIDVLETSALFFRLAQEKSDFQLKQQKDPFVVTTIGYGPDSKPGPTLLLAQPWNWKTVGQLGQIIGCVDGEAAKLVTEMLNALRDSQENSAIRDKSPQPKPAKLKILNLGSKSLKDDDLLQLPEDIDGLLLRGRMGYGANSITDDGIKHLTRLTKLRILAAGGLELTDRALETIGKLTTLEELSLEINKITGAGLRHLRGLKNLRKLNLDFNRLQPDDLEPISELTGLTSLRIYSTGIVNDRVCELCSRLTNLRELHLSERMADLTDRGVEHLAKLRHLENLTLMGCPKVTDASLAVITRMTRLKTLRLTELPPVTPKGMTGIGKLTELRVLEINVVSMDDASIRALESLTKLEELLLWAVASRPNHPSLDSLGALRSLRRFRTNMSMPSSAIRALATLPDLESINNELFEITDEDLTHLAKLPKLKTLVLASEKITVASLPTLAKMKSLRYLYATDKVGITPEQWTRLGQDSLQQCTIGSFRAPYTVYHKGSE